MHKRYLVLSAVALPALVAGCIKMDGFFWDTEIANSLEDYHNLPLDQEASPPSWVTGASVEREVYLRSPSGELLSPDSLAGESEYIHGVFLPAPEGCPTEQCPLSGTGVTFLYQHGNGGTMFRYWFRAVTLWNMGANVFIYNYRGWGLSRGSLTDQTVLEDAEVALEYVLTRPEVDPAGLVAYGYSMGGIPTSWLAGSRSGHRDDLAGVILECPFDGPRSTVAHGMGIALPAAWFVEMADWYGPDYIADATGRFCTSTDPVTTRSRSGRPRTTTMS